MVWAVWTIRRKVAVCLSFGAKVLHALPANIVLALDEGHLVTAAPLLEDSGKQSSAGYTPLCPESTTVNFDSLKAMEVQCILKGLVMVIMIFFFLLQMWELFDQFISELKTVAVSFKEENPIEFPSFAFCDSTAFTEKLGIISNATLYNATAFNVEEDISLGPGLIQYDLTDTYTVESFPTTFNGYCTLYEFHGKRQVDNLLSK